MLVRGTTARSKKAMSNCVLTFTRRTCPATLYGESPPKIAGTAVQEAALGRPGESLKDARQAQIAHPPTRILSFERQLIYGQSARRVLRADSGQPSEKPRRLFRLQSPATRNGTHTSVVIHCRHMSAPPSASFQAMVN